MSKRQGFAALQSDRWIDSELARCNFQDTRHGKRLRKLLEQLPENIGGTIPWACEDGRTPKQRTVSSNERVSDGEILGDTAKLPAIRLEAGSALILMLHDTTEFTFHRKEVKPIGLRYFESKVSHGGTLNLVQSEQVSGRSAQSPPEGLGIQHGHVPDGPRNRYYSYCHIIKGCKNRLDTRIGHRSSAHIPAVYSPVNIAGLFA
jgi:Transposase DNA-binding